MRITHQIFIVNILMSLCVQAEIICHSSNIVGYSGQDIKHGWNEVSVNFDQIGFFPVFTTLDKIISFEPSNGIIGDELVFDLDGYHQRYRIDSYDKNTNRYSLTRIRKKDSIPEHISFDWIPAPKVFWINHTTTNTVRAAQSGGLANGYKTILDMPHSSEKSKMVPMLKIVPIEATSPELKITLQGGKIKSQH